jgi:putative transcriptional regulator
MSNRNRASVYALVASLAALLSPTPATSADGADEAVLLVAQPELMSPLYGSTILLAKPIADGAHIGFIINKPTTVKLAEAFPEHEPSKKVSDPLFLGGPAGLNRIFALVERHDAASDGAMQITPDLFLASEAKAVDHIIEAEADHARFFVGLVVWRPGELDDEIKRGLWFVDEPDAKLVLNKKTDGLWEELVRRSEARAKTI